MPKSARKILLVLSSSSSMTQSEIKKKTGLSIRSVKGCLKLLKKKGFVGEHVVFEDMRRKRYSLRGCSETRQHKTIPEDERLQFSEGKPLVLGSNPNNPIAHGGELE